MGLYDADPAKIGKRVGGIAVRCITMLAEDAESTDIAVGIIATPAGVAQGVATLLSEVGIPSILNFAPAVLTVPEGNPPAAGGSGHRIADPQLLHVRARAG